MTKGIKGIRGSSVIRIELGKLKSIRTPIPSHVNRAEKPNYSGNNHSRILIIIYKVV